jgi:hypothetical protein
MRCAFFGWVYLTAPIEAGLYPIAGAAGVAGAGIGYFLARMVGGGYDIVHGWAWAVLFCGCRRFHAHRHRPRCEEQHLPSRASSYVLR